jgi:hypothetical protein
MGEAIVKYLNDHPSRGKGLIEIGWGVRHDFNTITIGAVHDALDDLRRAGRVKFIREDDPKKKLFANEGWSLTR